MKNENAKENGFRADPVRLISVKSAILHNVKKIIVIDTLQYRLAQI